MKESNDTYQGADSVRSSGSVIPVDGCQEARPKISNQGWALAHKR